MAASERILSLDLGTQNVGIGVFRADKSGGLVLTDYRETGLLADPAADASRMAQAKIAIGEMVEALGVSGSKVNFALSAQAVFTRFVKLPSVGEEQAEQIVAFEAQQNVPFPIDEVVWDYQLMDSGGSEVEVVLVAIKSDLLEEINGAVESSGLRTNIVDVSPMALYNAYRYNYGDQEGCTLLVDIGARTTNLIFIEPKKVFSRSIPIAGAKITEAISKEFNEAFGLSEERKRKDGFVSLGGGYADPDDIDVARASKMIRNSMTRLHSEIARSISFYRAQQHGAAPARVLLCGGSASLPYMREFFQEKFQLPVEFFNPLRNVAVDAGLDVEEIRQQSHTMGELVGLALRSLSGCPMELNLESPAVEKRQMLERKKPFIVMAGVCLLLIAATWFLYYFQAAAVTRTVSDKVQEKVQPLKDLENRMNAVVADRKRQEEAAEPLLRIINDRSYWVTVLEDINSRLTSDSVWVVSLGIESTAPTPGAAAPVVPVAVQSGPAKNGPAAKNQAKPSTVLMLRGLYLANPREAHVVEDFINNLKQSSMFEVRERELKLTWPSSNDTEWAYEYSVPLVLKNPISDK